jgi:sulfide dehydrogenase cytochrome subunit
VDKRVKNLLILCLAAPLSWAVSVNATAADIATLTAPCEDCHGKDGASTEPKIPIIGGYSAYYISESLTAYAEKSRPCEEIKYPAGEHKGETTTMCEVAKKLTEDEANQIADYFASKPFVRAKQTFDPELAKVGKGIHALQCKKCHEDGGSLADDDAGILAGQWMPYLKEQFEEYSAGKRPMPKKMKPKMDKLSQDDIKALIQYYGSFQ